MSDYQCRPPFPPELESLHSATSQVYHGRNTHIHYGVWNPEPVKEKRCAYCTTIRLPDKVKCDSCGAPY